MKGQWMVDPAGRTVLDTSEDLTALQAERDAQKARADKMTAQRDQARTELATVTADQAAITADRDAAQAKLAAVTAAHDTLATQMAKLEAVITSAGLSIQQAEPQP